LVDSFHDILFSYIVLYDNTEAVVATMTVIPKEEEDLDLHVKVNVHLIVALELDVVKKLKKMVVVHITGDLIKMMQKKQKGL